MKIGGIRVFEIIHFPFEGQPIAPLNLCQLGGNSKILFILMFSTFIEQNLLTPERISIHWYIGIRNDLAQGGR